MKDLKNIPGSEPPLDEVQMLFGWEDGQCAAEPSLDMEILAPPLPRCHAGLLNWSLCVEEEVQSFIDGPLLDPLVRSQYMIVVLCQSFWRLKEKYETRKYIYIYEGNQWRLSFVYTKNISRTITVLPAYN